MKLKKISVILACITLIFSVTVFGTIAYLTDKTDSVVNTFTVGKLLDNQANFVLLEHEAKDNDLDGVYTIADGAKETDQNTYKVLPGVNLPKDPFVEIKEEKLQLDAYVFVEVVDKTSKELTVTVDDATWTKVENAKPVHEDGVVYALKANSGIAKAGETFGPVSILKDNTITVGSNTIKNPGTLNFYGYLIQAGGLDTALEAWQKGFEPSATE